MTSSPINIDNEYIPNIQQSCFTIANDNEESSPVIAPNIIKNMYDFCGAYVINIRHAIASYIYNKRRAVTQDKSQVTELSIEEITMLSTHLAGDIGDVTVKKLFLLYAGYLGFCKIPTVRYFGSENKSLKGEFLSDKTYFINNLKSLEEQELIHVNEYDKVTLTQEYIEKAIQLFDDISNESGYRKKEELSALKDYFKTGQEICMTL